jgi:hypothetical protein
MHSLAGKFGDSATNGIAKAERTPRPGEMLCVTRVILVLRCPSISISSIALPTKQEAEILHVLYTAKSKELHMGRRRRFGSGLVRLTCHLLSPSQHGGSCLVENIHGLQCKVAHSGGPHFPRGWMEFVRSHAIATIHLANAIFSPSRQLPYSQAKRSFVVSGGVTNCGM